MNGIYPTHSRLRRKSTGFSLIEIMVAVTISLILLLGVTNIFMASKTSYSMQSGLSRLQENARFALDNMARNIGNAGLGILPPQTTTTFTLANTQDNVGQNTDFKFTTALGTASDSIEINYIAPVANTIDCVGESSPAGTTISAFYEVDIDTLPDGTEVSNLYCTNQNDTRQPLVEGVENMQILYGVDTEGAIGGGPDGIADRYVSADNVTEWGGINGGIASVRVALLVSTVEEMDTDISGDIEYRVLDSPPLGPFNEVDGESWYIDQNDDGHHNPDEARLTSMVRRVFTRTILIRNYPYTP